MQHTQTGRRSRRRTLRGGLLALMAALAPGAEAAEGGLGNFPFGAQTTYAAFLPAPGVTAFYGYALAYSADSVRDDRGKRVPGVDVEFFALAPRLVHSWAEPWAGFKLSSGVVIEGLYAKVSVPGVTDRNAGPTLLGVEPLYLQRSFGHWHVLTGPLFYLPIGPYSRRDPANTTVNYASFAYQASTTWTPTARWDISLNLAAEFKRRNPDTDLRSGTQSGLTFGVGHRPFADTRWDLGISGFYTRQLSDDEQGGRDVPGGGRTRKFAIGPKAVFWITPAAGIVAQWHRESGVRNGTQGDLYWLECAFPF